MKSKIILIAIVVLAALACGIGVWKLHNQTPATSRALNITTTTGNYGLFIDNQDSEYFATQDANVRNIINAYLAGLYLNPRSEAEKYGNNLVYYYTKDNFIVGGLSYWANINDIQSFVMYDMKTGQPISPCYIYGQAGLYKDANLLLSVSHTEQEPDAKNGICFYVRGAPNFNFIDLTPQLGANETLFKDPTGQSLAATVKDVDTKNQTFSVEVYDTTKKGADGNYAYKRSIELSFSSNVKLGIQEAIDPTILGKGLLVGINTWQGYVDGKLVSITGTAQRDNPSQGVLFVWEPDNGIGTSRTYLAPTATGPLKIISEENGVLTIQSLAGTYEANDIQTDARSEVKTKGGDTYSFLLEAREFRQ